MSGYAIAILAALVAALAIGRPSPFVWIVALGNFAVSRVLDFDPEYVAVADLAAAAVLATFGRPREVGVSIIFVAMASLEIIAHRLQAQTALIYTGTEVLAFLQAGVIGGADRGMGRFIRSIRGRGANRAYRPVAPKMAGSSGRLAQYSETHGRG